MNLLKQLSIVFLTFSLSISNYAQAAGHQITIPQTTILNFSKSPGEIISVKRGVEGNAHFERCHMGVEGSSVRLHNCKGIGRSAGYTLQELNTRWKQLTRKKWFHRLWTIPGGSVCGTILGGAVSAIGYLPIFYLGTLELIMAPLRGVVDGAEGLAFSLLTGALAMAMGALYLTVGATSGGFFGAIGGWFATRLLPSHKSAQALAPAVNATDAVSITIKGTVDRHERYLLKALGPLE